MKRFLLLSLTLLMTLLSCGKGCLTSLKRPQPSPQPSPTPQVKMQAVQGEGVQLLLPLTYVEHDLQKDLPALQEDFRKTIGEQSGPIGDVLNSIIDNLDDSVAYWGHEDGTSSAQSTDLLLLHNRELAKLPFSIVLPLIERILRSQGLNITSDSLNLAERDTRRFIFSDGTTAIVIYIFISADEIYLAIFTQSPDHLDTQLAVFDQIVVSLKIDASLNGGK